MHIYCRLGRILMGVVVAFLLLSPLYAKEVKIQAPKEFGTYIKTATGLKRLIPNVVFDEQGMLFIESNNPARFPLKDLEYFLIYGPRNMEVLTMNPLLFVQASALGKPRFIFGKNVDITVQDRGNSLHVIKPKGLLGRGYYCLWIEDTAWDFVIE